MTKSNFVVAKIYVRERLAQVILQPGDPSMVTWYSTVHRICRLQTVVVCLLHEFWLHSAYIVYFLRKMFLLLLDR